MKVFRYSATTREGTITKGTISALDRVAAFRELDQLKLEPLSLSEAAAQKPQKRSETAKEPEKIKLRQADILDFTNELAELLKGGIPLEGALGIIERRESKNSIPAVSREIRARVRDGKTLANAIRESSPDFGELYCRLVSAGEESGALYDILARHAVHLKALQGLKNRVVFALIYPAFLVVAALGVSVLFVTFLIPKLMELLESTGGSLPLGAQLIVGLGAFFQKTWFIWLGLILIAIWLCCHFAKNHPKKWDHLLLKIPLSGKIVHLRQQVQFLETMASLVRNGLPIVHGLTLTKNAIASPVYQDDIDRIRIEVQEGEDLSRSLQKSENFPSLMSDLIAVGEQTGDLAGAIERTAARFDADLTRQVDKLSAIIQPAVVIVMAGMVGIMAYLMISAIFQTVSGLGG